MKNLFALLFFIAAGTTNAQIGIGQWRDHLPYSTGKNVAASQDMIFCASPQALFTYHPESYEIERFSKVNGISDAGIADIAWNPESSSLLIAYDNGNMDLFREGSIENLADIKRSPIIGNKTINRITLEGKLAYLACGFGIVVLDMVKKEVRETYLINPQNQVFVTDIAIFNNRIFASTPSGIYSASLNHQNLADYAAWSLLNQPDSAHYNHMEPFAGKLIVNKTTGVYGEDSLFMFDGNAWSFFQNPPDPVKALTTANNELVVTLQYSIDIYDPGLNLLKHYFGYNTPAPQEAIKKGNDLWIADENNGLIYSWNEFGYNFINPGGPVTANIAALDWQAGAVWGTGGGVNQSWGNSFTQPYIYRFYDETWKSYSNATHSQLSAHFDFISIAVNPLDPTMAAAGTWGNDLVVFKGDTLTVFNSSNSTLINPSGNRLGGITYDSEANLWVANSFANNQLNLFRENQWYSFPLPGVLSEIGQTIRAASGHLWLVLPRGKGLAAHNPGEDLLAPDDNITVVLSTTVAQGGLPTNEVYSVAEDLDGEIWVGTAQGIVVFYNPSSVFTDAIQDAQPIKIDQDNTIQLLLESEIVTAISVDGANRKWLGTENGGVFLMSEDGQEQVYHFTEDNSPLLSNTIKTITIDHKTGEVFFGTDKGIVSFRSTATLAEDNFQDVYAFPNPVKPEYDGPVAIKGLVRDADVKITDMAGNLVSSGKAFGGQYVWNGRHLDGSAVGPGVYLVFATNEDGAQTIQTKLMVIR